MDGMEGETTAFTLSCIGCGISFFNILLACKDSTGEIAGEILTLGFVITL